MQAPDYGKVLYNLMLQARLYEQLHNKYPELMTQLGEIFHKEHAHPDANAFAKEIQVAADRSLGEIEDLLLLPKLPPLEKKYTEILKDVLQFAHSASSPTAIYKLPAATPVRIYLEGCWDLMHSGHFNAIRQVS